MVPPTPPGVEQSGHVTILCILVIVAIVLTFSMLMSIFLRYFDRYALVPEATYASRLARVHRGSDNHNHTRKSDEFGVVYLLDGGKIDIDAGIEKLEDELKFEAIVHPYG